MLWSGLFCISGSVVPPGPEAIPAVMTSVAEAYGPGTQAERYPQEISSEYFAQLANDELEKKLQAIGETRRHVLRLRRAPQPMNLPAGQLICEVKVPQQLAYGGVNPIYISVYVDGAFYRRSVCYYELDVYEHVLVATHDLDIEKTLAASDLRLEERSIDGSPGKYLTDMNQAVGRVPSRVIRAGTAIAAAMLQNPIVMDVGTPVTLVTSYGGVEAKAEGIAMQKGRVGKIIRVRNARSGKMLRGRVVDATTVEIMT